MAAAKVVLLCVAAVLATALAADTPAAPGLVPPHGVLGYVTSVMHYLTGVASGLVTVADAEDAPSGTLPTLLERLPDQVVVADPELRRHPGKFKYTVDELLHARFDRKMSNDIDIDPCKGGE